MKRKFFATISAVLALGLLSGCQAGSVPTVLQSVLGLEPIESVESSESSEASSASTDSDVSDSVSVDEESSETEDTTKDCPHTTSYGVNMGGMGCEQKIQFKCMDCGLSEIRIIELHKYELVLEEATDTAPRQEYEKCSECGKVREK